MKPRPRPTAENQPPPPALPIGDELKAARAAEDAIGSIPWECLKECKLVEISAQFQTVDACTDWQSNFILLACSSGDEPACEIQKSLQIIKRCTTRRDELRGVLKAARSSVGQAAKGAMKEALDKFTQAIMRLTTSIAEGSPDSSSLPGHFRKMAQHFHDVRSQYIQLEGAHDLLEEAVNKYLMPGEAMRRSPPPLFAKGEPRDSVSVRLDTLFAGPWRVICKTISEINTPLTELKVMAGAWELLPIHLKVLNSPKMTRWQIEYGDILPGREGVVIQKAVEDAIKRFARFLMLSGKSLTEPVLGLLPETANPPPSLTMPAAKGPGSGQSSVTAESTFPDPMRPNTPT
jgi:hypothetical protein